MKRLGELKVQCDRWPVSDLPNSPQVLSVIIMGLYDEKPSVAAIASACEAAAKILRSGH
jgi:hypothetical protein